MNVVPGINEWSALAVWVMIRFFLVRVVQLRVYRLLIYTTCGERIGDNFLSFTVGGALALRQRHCEEIWLKKMNEVFEEEETKKKGKTEREFWKEGRSLCLDYRETPS